MGSNFCLIEVPITDVFYPRILLNSFKTVEICFSMSEVDQFKILCLNFRGLDVLETRKIGRLMPAPRTILGVKRLEGLVLEVSAG